ncbi:MULTISPECIES: IdsF [unclassified Brenneria]|uniref:IdsF n=1 Tax=unclassified Brenneria TaxID=2634434 RepID=UPI0018F0F292|nr:IdsF [Brenneria sp. L3-3C-1]MBJ7223031.1 IdsF [Brenneria sp. L3-3C-1]MEE3644270.1 IdsF [Brenneria sp. L3_3C_1]
MKSWKRKIQNTILIFFKSIFIIIFMTVFSVKAKEVINTKYLFSFNSHKSSCILRVNNFPAIDTSNAEQGTMSAGFNLTAFLENGANDIELLMGPQDHKDPNTLFADSSCQVIISKETENTSTEIANFTLSVNNQGKITADGSTNYTRAVSSGIFNTEIRENYTKDEKDHGLYKLRSNIILRDLPRWSWVNATPVTEHDLLKIRKAYTDIWLMMKERDIEGLKQITRISNQEMAFAEGATTGMIFISSDFPQHVIDKQLTPLPIEWNKYKLITYRGGRLFRLGVGYFQNSPLRFIDAYGDIAFAYNPYFSIIDGKVTLVR